MSLSLAVATVAFAAIVARPDPQVQPRPITSRLPSLTRAQKVAKALEQLKIKTPPRGITSLVTLTVRQPYASPYAALEFLDFRRIDPNDGETGTAYGYHVGTTRAVVDVNLKIVKVGKPHLATFYFFNERPQDVKIGTFKTGTAPPPGTTYPMGGGHVTLVHAFVPTKAEPLTVQLSAVKEQYFFYKVEVDVME